MPGFPTPKSRLSPARLAGHIRLLPTHVELRTESMCVASLPAGHPGLLSSVLSSSSKTAEPLAFACTNAGRQQNCPYLLY